MKRTLALTLTGLLVVVLLAGLTLAEAIRPSAWEEELDAYLEHARRSSGESVTRRAVLRARHPARFTSHLGGASYGADAFAHREAPYPPARVYCVYVERGMPGGPLARQVTFVALHRDLHYADWIVYEGVRAPFDEGLASALDDLGCPHWAGP